MQPTDAITDRSASVSRRGGDPISPRSLTLSLIIHLILGLALIFLGFQGGHGHPGEPDRDASIVLTVVAADDRAPEYLDASKLPSPAANVPADAAATDLPPDLPPALSPRQPTLAVDLPGSAGDTAQLDASAMLTSPGGSGQLDSELADADRAVIEADREWLRTHGPAGPATTIRVFGSADLTGRSFLFLLDRSKSMGGGGLGVMQRARTELSRAIEQLQPHHRFQIIGYHQQTIPMVARRLLPATADHKAQVEEFIGQLAAYGATDHRHALLAAATYRADVIVLLTDGGPPELNDAQIQEIIRLAGSTEIHCLHFGFGSSTQPPHFLKQLADQSGGDYRYLDVGNWKSP